MVCVLLSIGETIRSHLESLLQVRTPSLCTVNMKYMKRFIWHDVQVGISLSCDDKIEIAKSICELGMIEDYPHAYQKLYWSICIFLVQHTAMDPVSVLKMCCVGITLVGFCWSMCVENVLA